MSTLTVALGVGPSTATPRLLSRDLLPVRLESRPSRTVDSRKTPDTTVIPISPTVTDPCLPQLHVDFVPSSLPRTSENPSSHDYVLWCDLSLSPSGVWTVRHHSQTRSPLPRSMSTWEPLPRQSIPSRFRSTGIYDGVVRSQTCQESC